MSELAQLATLVARWDVGALHALAPQQHGGTVSNQHYVVDAEQGRFFLKCVLHADALYGASGRAGVERLRTVTRAVAELHAAGFGAGLERPLPTRDGEIVVEDGDAALRLYRFLDARPFARSDADVDAALAAITALHERGAALLSSATRSALESLPFPYALSTTAGRLDELLDWAAARPGLGDLGARRPALARWVEAALRALERPVRSLVHLDFHPDNVLFVADRAVVIDMDNAMIGDRRKCQAFTVLRFAAAVGATPQSIAARWARSMSEPETGFVQAVLAVGQALEVEKVLRILARAKDTGAYLQFLPAIESKHLPSIAALDVALAEQRA